MKPIHTIRRLACTLAGLATAALAFAAAAPAAQAADSPPAAGAGGPTIRVVPASSAMTGGGPASGGPGAAACVNRASTSNFHQNLASQATLLPVGQLPTNAVSVPTWSGSFTTGGTAYPFTMVGTDPAAGQATHVPVEIIPLRMDFAGSGCVLEKSGMAADLEASPLFTPTALNTGVTQQLDDYQRGSFWSTVSTTSPGYHLLLDPSDVPAVTLHVPAAQGLTFFNLNTNRTVGAVSGDWFRRQLQGLLNSLHVSPTTLAVFVPYNTFVTDQNPNDCLRPSSCAVLGGFHSAAIGATNPNAINTFAYAAYQDAGTSSPFNWSTLGLSHEILEWAADPFAHSSRIQGQAAFLQNMAPAWSSPYLFGGSTCMPVLEVADPLVEVPIIAPPDQHLLADGAFLPWFARQSPSTGIYGLYDMAGIFSTYSTAC
jgi:hypothetical protein